MTDTKREAGAAAAKRDERNAADIIEDAAGQLSNGYAVDFRDVAERALAGSKARIADLEAQLAANQSAQPAPAAVAGPDWYHAECDDPDRSGFYLKNSDAQTQVDEHGGYVTELYTAPQPQQIAEPKGQESPADAWLRGHIAGLEKAQDVCRIVGAQDTNFEAVDCAYAIYEQKLMVDIFDYMPPPVSTKEPS